MGADSYYKHQHPTGVNWAFSKQKKMLFLVGRESQQHVTKLSRCPKRPISWTDRMRAFKDKKKHVYKFIKVGQYNMDIPSVDDYILF